ncbi:MAG: hypothetical protein R3D85_02155 [Paracoccaceae bacterium]
MLAAPPVAADQVISDDLIVFGGLCVGYNCADGETFGFDWIRLKHTNNRIHFDDTSTGNFPANDWRLAANDNAEFGGDYFAIQNATADTVPFVIWASAPENQFSVDDTGVGIGTVFPALDLHIKSPNTPGIRLEQDTSGAWPAQIWDMRGNDGSFFLYNVTHLTTPIRVESGAVSSALYIDDDSNIGMRTAFPEASLHIVRGDGTGRILLEESAYPASPRTLLHLSNRGRAEIVMANIDTGGEWSFGAGTNFVLKQGVVDSASSAKTKLFEITAAGNATLAGTLTTGGPSCGGGCDAVFDPDYDLPSISAHAERMFALGHLPNVGPTLPGAPVNMSEQYGRLLNELEHAHIYIARLEDRLARVEARLDR